MLITIATLISIPDMFFFFVIWKKVKSDINNIIYIFFFLAILT